MLGPIAGVEFDGQIDQLEEDQGPKRNDSKLNQGWYAQHRPRNNHDDTEVPAKRRSRYRKISHHERNITVGILNCVTSFVSSNTNGCRGTAAVNILA